jgi:hypothetical protein
VRFGNRGYCEFSANIAFWSAVAGPTGHAPQGHHRIADVLVNHSPALDNRRVYGLPELVQHIANFFSVHHLCQSGKTRYIGKENGDLFALLFGVLGLERGPFFAQRDQGNIHHTLSQNGALGFQSGYRPFKFFVFVHQVNLVFYFNFEKIAFMPIIIPASFGLG